MEDRLDSLLVPGVRGDNLVAVLANSEKPKLGSVVTLTHGDRTYGTRKVTSVVATTLTEVSCDDLIGFIYGDPSIFWRRVEAKMACGQPGEMPVLFVTLGLDWSDENTEQVLDIEEDAPMEEPIKRRTSKSNKTEDDA